MALKAAVLSTLLLFSCGTKPKQKPSPSVQVQLEQMVAGIKVKPMCKDLPSKADCDIGDMTLFNGLLCAAGNTLGCTGVKNAVGPDGRLWRHPSLVGKEGIDTASRDMMMGLLLYLSVSKDLEVAKRFSSYLKLNGKLCPVSSDSRCNLNPNVDYLMGMVYKSIGAPLPSPKTWDGTSSRVMDAALLTMAVNNPLGYQSHLVAVQVLIRKLLKTETGTITKVAQALAERDPSNPFFLLLNEGLSDKVANLAIEQIAEIEDNSKAHQWSFERDSKEQAWKESMGWEWSILLPLSTTLSALQDQ